MARLGCSSLSLFLVTLACGPAKSGDAADTQSDTGTTGDEATTTEPDASGTEEGSTTGEPSGPIPARDIEVDWIEVNQGVGVKVGADGIQVPPEERTAYLLANRRALFRVFWAVPDDWEPREIQGQLHLTLADGTVVTKKQKKLVERDSFIGSLDETFNFEITAEEAQPGLRFQVELYEVEPLDDGRPPPETPPRLPADGSKGFVGIEDSYQVLKIVVVPFDYDDGMGCATSPDTSEETMQLFYDLMYMMNPVDRLDITLHDPVEWKQPLTGFSQLNSFLSNLRFEENAPPETYYYGLVDVCAGGLGGAGGQAYGIPTNPTDMGAAYQRVSSGLSLDPQWSAETFVHEVGHSQGRRHVACNGEEGGPDPNYPIPGGDVGEWGFGVIDTKLRHPTVNKDYMTYCHPVWVSTWGWNKVYPVIRALSTWDPDYPGNGAPRPDDPYGGSLLVGALLPDGQEIWHTVPGSIAAEELDDEQIEFSVDGRVVAVHGARVTPMSEGGPERLVVTPLPAAFETVTGMTRITADSDRHPIDRASVQIRHHARRTEHTPAD